MAAPDHATGDPARTRQGRTVLRVEDVAGGLEHRLHWPGLDRDDVRAGCAFAAKAGLAAVLCRPEHVTLAADRLVGSGVDVVTALGFDDSSSPLRAPIDLAQQAREFVGRGAGEVALVASPGALPTASAELLIDQVIAVTEALDGDSAGVRVLLDTTAMTELDVLSCCSALANAGVCLVQAGSFRGDRTGFHLLELMRDALPAPVLLKWTHPVGSLDTLLVCIALGVDRFNGQPVELLAAATQMAATGPLTVPLPGLDF